VETLTSSTIYEGILDFFFPRGRCTKKGGACPVRGCDKTGR
jgi:hypothetical protein